MTKKIPVLETLMAERRGPLPPKYSPKLRVRVANDRNKKISEFEIDLPIDGHIADLFPVIQKLRVVLELHDLLPKTLSLVEPNGKEESPKAEAEAQA